MDNYHGDNHLAGAAKIQRLTLPHLRRRLFAFSLLLIAVIAMFIHSQWLTGPLVNALLIITYLKLGYRSAFFLAFIPSITALTTGLLPFVIAPIIPFIVTANIILITVYYLSGNLNFFVTLFIAGFLKYLFLSSSLFYLGHYFIPEIYLQSVLAMMGWQQFVTAIVGGLLAYVLVKGFEHYVRRYSS